MDCFFWRCSSVFTIISFNNFSCCFLQRLTRTSYKTKFSLYFCLLSYHYFHIYFNCAIFLTFTTAWKLSKYGFFSGTYFSVFGVNTGNYGPEKTPYLDNFHTVDLEKIFYVFVVKVEVIICDYLSYLERFKLQERFVSFCMGEETKLK